MAKKQPWRLWNTNLLSYYKDFSILVRDVEIYNGFYTICGRMYNTQVYNKRTMWVHVSLD